MEQLLRELLERLSVIEADHSGLTDTEVAEKLTEAVYQGFLKPAPGYQLPDHFGMTSAAADQRVKEALGEFLARARPLAEEQGMTFHQRLAAFQNLGVTVGPQRLDYNDYFRYFPPGRYDVAGDPLSGG
jgi:hypothetical protein